MYVCTLTSSTQIIWIINISIPFGNLNSLQIMYIMTIRLSQNEQ